MAQNDTDENLPNEANAGSAAVPGCGFQHRLGACPTGGETPPEPAGGTPALRENCETNPCAWRAGSKFGVKVQSFTKLRNEANSVGGHRPPLQGFPRVRRIAKRTQSLSGAGKGERGIRGGCVTAIFTKRTHVLGAAI